MLQDDKKINIIIRRLIFVVALFAVFFVLVSVVNIFKSKKNVEAEIEKIKKENVFLVERKNELRNLSDYFQDKNFIEKEARRRLNLQKSGEKEVVVIEERNNSNQMGSGQARILDAVDFTKKQSDGLKTQDRQADILHNPLKWFNFIFK